MDKLHIKQKPSLPMFWSCLVSRVDASYRVNLIAPFSLTLKALGVRQSKIYKSLLGFKGLRQFSKKNLADVAFEDEDKV